MTQGNNPNFCDQCGFALISTAQFCGGCGRPLKLAPDNRTTSYYQTPKSPKDFWGELNNFGKGLTVAIGLIPVFVILIVVISRTLPDNPNNNSTLIVKETSRSSTTNSQATSTRTKTPIATPVKTIENLIYEEVSLGTIAAELENIKTVRKENPMRGDMFKTETYEKWMLKKIQTNGEIHHIPGAEQLIAVYPDRMTYIIIREDGLEVQCDFPNHHTLREPTDAEWEDLLNSTVGETTTVTGQISDISQPYDINTGQGHLMRFRGYILFLTDCQIGTESDRN